MRWEAEQLSCKLDFDECQVDPAPFQLVEKTSLYKVSISYLYYHVSESLFISVHVYLIFGLKLELLDYFSGCSFCSCAISFSSHMSYS